MVEFCYTAERAGFLGRLIYFQLSIFPVVNHT